MSNLTIHKTQVVIAGGGPTGLSLAAQLIRHNIDFILLEKNEKTTELSKAVVVQARTLEIFQELGIVEEALKRGKMTTSMRLFSKGKQKAALDLAGLGQGISEFTFALSLEQSKTEKLLAEYITTHGKSIQWESEISRFEQNKEGVTIYYKNGQGIEEKIEADYLVGCDGSSSAVRHQLNLSFEGSTEPKLFYVADVQLKSTVINQDALYMYMIKKGFVLFFPMEGTGHYRIIGILPDGDINKQYQFSDIAPVIKESIQSPLEVEVLRWFSTYKVHSRKAGAFMKERCFIAGDAAHIHTPAGGQGMNTGIQDAYNLAWKLAYTLRGETKPAILNTYNTERSGNAKHLLQTTDRMFDIMTGSNAFLNFLRLNLFPYFFKLIAKSSLAKHVVFPLLSQTDIAYPDSALTIKSAVGKVKAGDRMHYFVFSNGKSIFSYLTEPCFKLLYFGNKESVKLSANTLKITSHTFQEIPEAVFGKNTDFYILLRPDNHISYIGNDLEKCNSLTKSIATKA